MIKVSLEPCKGGWEDKIKAIKKAKGDYAEVGWFGEQGPHEGTTMTFAEMAEYHASGHDWVTPRPMLHIALELFAQKQPREVAKAITRYLLSPTQINLDLIIETIGKEYWNTVKLVIGNPAYLEVTDNPTPLLDTGQLEKHTAYRTNKNRTLRT